MADTNIDSEQAPPFTTYGMYPQSTWTREAWRIKEETGVSIIKASVLARAKEVASGGNLARYYADSAPGELDRLAKGLNSLLESPPEGIDPKTINDLLAGVNNYRTTTTVEVEGGLSAPRDVPQVSYFDMITTAGLLAALALYAWKGPKKR